MRLPTSNLDCKSNPHVNITYSEIPDAYIWFLEAGRDTSTLSRKHEGYRKLYVIHASGCVCDDFNLGEGLRALQSTDGEEHLNGWAILFGHDYEPCSQEPFQPWQWTLWEHLQDLWKEEEGKDRHEDGQRGREQIGEEFDAIVQSLLDGIDADAAARQSLLQNVPDLVRANRYSAFL